MSTSPFDPSSRYSGIGTGIYTTSDGRQIVYLRRRFVPQPEALAPIRDYIVLGHDRPDTIAAQQYGDATQSWQLADANFAFDPADLTRTPGRRLIVALPQGIPGTPHV